MPKQNPLIQEIASENNLQTNKIESENKNQQQIVRLLLPLFLDRQKIKIEISKIGDKLSYKRPEKTKDNLNNHAYPIVRQLR